MTYHTSYYFDMTEWIGDHATHPSPCSFRLLSPCPQSIHLWSRAAQSWHSVPIYLSNSEASGCLALALSPFTCGLGLLRPGTQSLYLSNAEASGCLGLALSPCSLHPWAAQAWPSVHSAYILGLLRPRPQSIQPTSLDCLGLALSPFSLQHVLLRPGSQSIEQYQDNN